MSRPVSVIPRKQSMSAGVGIGLFDGVPPDLGFTPAQVLTPLSLNGGKSLPERTDWTSFPEDFENEPREISSVHLRATGRGASAV